MKRYNIINNSLGWLCFVIAAVTYLLTIEPTASFWDCPEFISQGYKLEVGHPPGNPIFILAARFFVNFAGSDTSNVAVAVNVMSALLSAATILLLFWTITHFMRRLIAGRSTEDISAAKMIVIMAGGLVGALAYTWSDTFWFSAVEGEVYAFSSFCTALVVWLVLKWENRADEPHSDRYLILIAYIIGISIAVHLLNLLTIPALALVIYFRKSNDVSMKNLLLAILGSFVVIALILYGLVPGFVEIAQSFELFFVNTLGMSYNMGVLFYAIILVGALIWTIKALYAQKNLWEVRVSFFLSVVLSGIPFIGSGWVIPAVLIIGLGAYLMMAKKIPVRLLNISAISILVIFIGYSSYALLLIRASANPPMNQNSPDNVFTLSSYLNREQYGDTPLFFGQSFASYPNYEVNTSTGEQVVMTSGKKSEYTKVVKTSPDEPDRYVEVPTDGKPVYSQSFFFPRMYSSMPDHVDGYLNWIGETMQTLPQEDVAPLYDQNGNNLSEYKYPIPTPTFAHNLRYFLNYQLGYMYWRYFMWNFAGRQNDLQGQGELNRGNWISGIPAIDNARLGDQSLLPDEFGEGNKGHNVFYMLPLLLGLLGIAAQFISGIDGVKQFWVVFFFFFMTGIAIVLYLNQPPMQPRERDYAFAGSFYAFAIWIGLGVYTLWRGFDWAMLKIGKGSNEGKTPIIPALLAGALCLIVPLQMVSQTWDDHDRSGRYTTRDYGMNYLSSLDENAIIFTNGDNDTFPLWYAQEVEGYRKDVRVINLAYLGTDWYANHAKLPSYEAAAIDMLAEPIDYGYNRLAYSFVQPENPSDTLPADVFASLRDLYKAPEAIGERGYRVMRHPNMYIPVNVADAVSSGLITADEAAKAEDFIPVDLSYKNGVMLNDVLSLDMIASGTKDGWKRPTYFAMTVPNEYYLNLLDNLRSTGLAYEVTPLRRPGQQMGVATDKMYDNVMNRFKWGGLDQLGENGEIYLDETVRRMVSTHRIALTELATELYNEGVEALYPTLADSVAEPGEALSFDRDRLMVDASQRKYAQERFRKASDILNLIEEKLPAKHSPLSFQTALQLGNLYGLLGQELEDESLTEKGLKLQRDEIMRYAAYVPYLTSLINDEQRARANDPNNYSSRPVGLGSVNVSMVDKYIPQVLLQLIQDYNSNGGDSSKLLDELENRYPGFTADFSSLINF